MATTPSLGKKSSTNDVDGGTDELEDTPLLEKKSSTKDVDKGTDELIDMKKSVVTIRRKGLDKFEGQSKGYTGWLKLDSAFLKTKISTINSELYKEFYEKNIGNQGGELYKTFIVPFDK